MSGSGISWAIRKSAPHSRQITTPAPHHSVFYWPDALPAAQPTVSKHWKSAGYWIGWISRHPIVVLLCVSAYVALLILQGRGLDAVAVNVYITIPPVLYSAYYSFSCPRFIFSLLSWRCSVYFTVTMLKLWFVSTVWKDTRCSPHDCSV